ncbi:TetR/AcrR family transcriptional regulator [Paraburkholderia sp. IMGN_8]|uniref:TetR/AcrR family transcriptional regulator n=1 Tax=Paraburkholderia sp. IMGN_8 TaxID=3136564 RepID=UPI0031015F78
MTKGRVRMGRGEMSSGEKQQSIREQQKLMTQERLLDAAVRVFLARGYSEATTDDIVAEAGVGRATFYLHFKSKLEVMRSLIRVVERQNESIIDEFVACGSPTREFLESWLRRFIGHWIENGDRFLVGFQALASEPELYREIDVGIRLATDALCRMMKSRQEMQIEEVQLRADLLVGALQQACRKLVSNPQRYSVDLAIRVLTDIWASNLGI